MSTKSLEEITAIVKNFILAEFLPGENASVLTDETELITGGILDSFTTLRLASFLAEEFQIDLEAYEMGVDGMNTLPEIAKLVQSKF